MIPVRAALKLGSLTLELPALQAALSGYSDLPMRRVARAHGAPFAFCEVVIDEQLLTRGKGRRRVLEIPEDDHPVGGQLMGARPEAFGAAARDLVAAGYDLVDINFGCPVSKVLGRCRGGYLLGHPEIALEIVDRVVQAVACDVPVTVKMRRGFDAGPEAEKAFFAILDGAFARGVEAVTVHGRTVRQKYEGRSDWGFLTRVKRHLGSQVVFGSGDLFTAGDAVRMLEETGVDGVSLARGCIGNPFLFRQVADRLAGRPERPPTVQEQRRALEMHYRFAVEHYGPERAVGKTRVHAIRYAEYNDEPVRARDSFVGVRDERSFFAALDAVMS